MINTNTAKQVSITYKQSIYVYFQDTTKQIKLIKKS